MHLKSLTLRGFKSFADPTTLQFEPGVTVVVGPNGSGKSNVVDAVAWVLGAQGPSVVRSSKMDDVIFAGTARRPALGRAEVSLTIDNASRRLPVDLAEVTITRTLFRSGESEYSMNGAPCRLLDIQEMLSDAGVGRQQHVIMSQGQLASVLDARPEDRRAIIEEAAGILKFRRRRERAERRLDATEANMTRLQDLLREVRRQLRPLERQAEAARRHDSLVAELHGLRLHIAGQELDSLKRRIAENEAARSGLASGEAAVLGELNRLDDLVSGTEESLGREQASDVVAVLARAERLHERACGLRNVVTERRRRVEADLGALPGAAVIAALSAEADAAALELAAANEAALALAPERDGLEAEAEELGEAVGRLVDPTRASVAAATSSHEPRRLRDDAAGELARAREVLARVSERASSLTSRHTEEAERLAALSSEAIALEARFHELRRREESAEEAEREAARAVNECEATARSAVTSVERLHARAEALREALDEVRARAGVARLAGLPGVLGSLLDLVEVTEGYELAFEAAVGEALAAVVVDGGNEARRAIDHLLREGVDGAVLPALGGHVAARSEQGALRPLVRGTSEAADGLLDRLLAGVVVCEGGIGRAIELAEEEGPSPRVVVTTEGDRLSASGWRIGAGRSGATRAALAAVEAALQAAEDEAGRAQAAADEARRRWTSARGEAAEATREAAAASASLGRLSSLRMQAEEDLGTLAAVLPQLEAERSDAAEAVEVLSARLGELEVALERVVHLEEEERAAESELADERRVLEERGRDVASRRSDLEVRAAAVEERRTVLTARSEEISRRLAETEHETRHAAEGRESAEDALSALSALARVIEEVASELSGKVAAAGESRRRHDEVVARLSEGLSGARAERQVAERELQSLRERSQRLELERAEVLVRLETAVEAVRRDLDAEVEEALSAPCPPLPPGIPAAARVRELDRELRLLGPINPLALEELAALEERDRFLSGQLEDVKSTRRDLTRVIRAVDEEIVGLFSQAFADVSSHFEELFSTLFPGGSGRLSLLDPADLLGTGVEIEARPAGRNVRRLSLLSGGERSLVALAFLFAVFRSRPSPFYLMDEVEAALDDVNLHRFLDLVDEFRHEAQLVIVSHQKRTMESADVLYGVTMQSGGASKVVSERLSAERTAVSA